MELYNKYKDLTQSIPLQILEKEYAAINQFLAPFGHLVVTSPEKQHQTHCEIFALNLVLLCQGVRLGYRIDGFACAETVHYLTARLGYELQLLPANDAREPLVIRKADLKIIANAFHSNLDCTEFLGHILGYPYLWQDTVDDGRKGCYLISFHLDRKELFGYKVPKNKYTPEMDHYNSAFLARINQALSFLPEPVVIEKMEI